MELCTVRFPGMPIVLVTSIKVLTGSVFRLLALAHTVVILFAASVDNGAG